MSSRLKSCRLLLATLLVAGSLSSALAQLGDRPNEPQAPPNADINIPPARMLTPEEALKTLVVPPGFRVELIAADPLIQDPVMMTFDPRGRLWVAELGSYNEEILAKLPIYIDPANPPPKPVGRISILSDTDGDGRMDKRTVFLDDLKQPRAIGFWKDKVLIGDPPNLWLCSDTNNDGVADEKIVLRDDYVFTDVRNIESAPNGLMWGRDNWLYNASYLWRLREVNGKWVTDPMPRLGQWGITQDDLGRMYFDSNSDKLRASLMPPHYAGRAGANTVLADVSYPVAADHNVFPIRPTTGVNRGYEKGFLRDDGSLVAVTAASAPLIYRGGNFPARYDGNAFVPEPAGNTVQRIILREGEGRMIANNGYEQTDFLSSIDERFRPVFLANAPDGSMYVVDLHRGYLEGYEFATTFLRDQILKRGLHKPLWGQGRIYRISYTGGTVAKLPNFSATSPEGLVALLDDANGWTRDQAQRTIVESGKAAEFSPRLREMYRRGVTERQRIYALWCLEGLGAFSADDLAMTLKDASAQVRIAGIRAAEPLLRTPEGAAALQGLVARIPTEDPLVLAQLALSLDGSTSGLARDAVWQMLPRAAEHPSLLDAVLLVCRDRSTELVDRFVAAARGSGVPLFGGKVMASAIATRIALQEQAAAHDRLGAAIVDPTVPEWCRIALMQGVVQPNLRGSRPGTRITISSEKLSTIAKAAPDALVRRFAGQSAETARLVESRRKRGADVVPMNPAEQRLFAQGQATFLVCAACHQPDGLGKEAIAPSLKDGRWSTAASPDAAIRIVLHGKQGTPGFPAAMVPLASLSDEQIAGVVTYIRRSFGNQASAVTTADVSRVRGATASRGGAWNDADLEKAEGQ